MWEQILTVGAAGQNLMLAANALGFGVQWLTEWYSYDDNVKDKLGLDEKDAIAGFFYIGTPLQTPNERERPNVELILNKWGDQEELVKGDCYNRNKFDFPNMGVEFFK